MRKMILFLGTIMMLVLGLGMSVMAISPREEQISREEYQNLEEEYITEARQILLEKGCKNAGINLTYQADEEGNREYTVTVYHRKIKTMNSQEWALLQARMKEVGDPLIYERICLVRILKDRET